METRIQLDDDGEIFLVLNEHEIIIRDDKKLAGHDGWRSLEELVAWVRNGEK